MVARLLAEGLQHQTGQVFIVENKPGASGNLGTDAVAKATPDGATLGVSIGGPLAINTLLFSYLPYDPRKDIAPITQLITQPSALVINAGLGIGSARELVGLLREQPGKYNYALASARFPISPWRRLRSRAAPRSCTSLMRPRRRQ
jgi:tripartite-type tricarboxylate transporter receptor subunit TctC